MHAPDFTAPNDIDGTPREVAAASLAQLVELASWLEEVVRATTVQVRGAVLSTALHKNPEADAEELQVAWAQSTEAAAMEALALRCEKVAKGAGATVAIVR